MSFSDLKKKIKESTWNLKEINNLNIEIVYLRHFMSRLWRLWSKTHLKQNSSFNDIFIVDKYNYLVCKISFISTILISIYNKYSLSYFYLNNTSIAVTGVRTVSFGVAFFLNFFRKTQQLSCFCWQRFNFFHRDFVKAWNNRVRHYQKP